MILHLNIVVTTTFFFLEPSPPHSLEVFRQTSDSIGVQWTSAEIHHVVAYRKSADGPFRNKNVSRPEDQRGDGFQTTLTGLDSNSRYEIKVRSLSDQEEYSDYSEAVIGSTSKSNDACVV